MTRDEFFQFSDLEREFNAGHLPALFDAVVLARANAVALPEWATLATLNLIIERFNTTRGRKRSRYALDYIHWLRWQKLSGAFLIRGITYSKQAGRPAQNIKEAREDAVKMCAGNIAQGTARQIQKSFDIVERARVSGDDARFTFGYR